MLSLVLSDSLALVDSLSLADVLSDSLALVEALSLADVLALVDIFCQLYYIFLKLT